MAHNIYIDSSKMIEYGSNGQTKWGCDLPLFYLLDLFSLLPRLAVSQARSATHQDAL
jgi:hypothetical protein